MKTKNKYEFTPLHNAAAMGHTKTALAYIKAGAVINAKDEQGFTPLDYAIRYAHTKTERAIKKAGGIGVTE